MSADNWGMVGHEWAVRLLQEHIRRDQVRHAYLFSGPAGTGRRTLALHFAQALNCPQPPAPGVPCGTCSTCKRIAAQKHPDLLILESGSIGATFKVDPVRELLHSLALAPYEARYRIALLRRFEEAKDAASNALLKTLEEPPRRAVILMTADSPESLLPTVVSRCEVLRLGALPVGMVARALEERFGVPAAEAHLLAATSGGRPGYALSLHNAPQGLRQRADWLDDLVSLLPASRVERFQFAAEHAEDQGRGRPKSSKNGGEIELEPTKKENARSFLLVWLSFWRDVLIRTTGAGVPLENLDREAQVAAVASQLSTSEVRGAMLAIEKAIRRIDGNSNLRLLLEVLLLDLPVLKVIP